MSCDSLFDPRAEHVRRWSSTGFKVPMPTRHRHITRGMTHMGNPMSWPTHVQLPSLQMTTHVLSYNNLRGSRNRKHASEAWGSCTHGESYAGCVSFLVTWCNVDCTTAFSSAYALQANTSTFSHINRPDRADFGVQPHETPSRASAETTGTSVPTHEKARDLAEKPLRCSGEYDRNGF